MEKIILWTLLLTLTFTDCLTDSGFIITAPKTILPGSDETVCISLIELRASVTLSLIHPTLQFLPPIAESTSDGEENGDFCMDLTVPLILDATVLTLHAHVVGETESGDAFDEEDSKTVSIQKKSLETFIQTDKPIYRAGQKVKIRILTLEYPSMKPYTDQNYEQIWVTSPNDIRMRQWLDVHGDQGLVDLSVPLSSEPLLGAWTIHALIGGETITQTFKIAEYVLPKFEVIIKPPSYIFILEEEVTVKICGVYSYGQPVRGSIETTFSASGVTQTQDIADTGVDGCHDFTLDMADLNIRYATSLIIEATFTEEATEVSQTERHSSTQVSNRPLKLKLVGQDGFKPGLPYRGQVIATRPDGTRAADQALTITANKNGASGENFSFQSTCTTDSAGKCDFTITTPLDPFIVEIIIQAAFDSSIYQNNARQLHISTVTDSKTVTAWYSPSGSFVQIRPLPGKHQADENVPATVEFTIADSTLIQFYYRVFSKGKLVHHGEQTWSVGSLGRRQRFTREDASVVREKRSIVSPRRRSSTEDPPALERYSQMTTAEVTFSVPVTPRMAPKATLVVYYIRSDGEVVSGKEEFKVALEFENRVSADFNTLEINPGGHVTLNIHANPGSLCAIGAVDKSVLLLEDSNQINKESVFSPLTSSKEPTAVKDTRCPDEGTTVSRKKRSSPVRPFHFRPSPFGRPIVTSRQFKNSKHLDALWAFKSSSVNVLTNFNLETRPCWTITETDTYYQFKVRRRQFGVPGLPGAERPVAANPGLRFDVVPNFATIDNEIGGSSPPVTLLRSHFPETWLWFLTYIGPSGQSSLPYEVPHTITDWVTTGFCTSTEHGIGVLSPVSLRAFQSFFLSMTLPYSVIREELVPIKVTVFNYRNDCFNVMVRMEHSSSFSITDSEFAKMVCVCGNQAESVTFEIIPRRLGRNPITVSAEYVPPSLDVAPCGNSVMMMDMVDAQDAVEESLLVEAEGAETEETTSKLICPSSVANGIYRKNIDLDLPFNVIPGSAYCKVQLSGDVLGPVLTNLEHLLRMPTGCGEQNMIGFTPNIFVLQYLNRTRQDLPELVEKAKEHMEIGYQRELNYRLTDGSYSAFGERDGEGSTWLTAFVLKSFAQASEFIAIDSMDLEVTKNWLLSNTRQEESGHCFSSSGRVIHKEMQGAHSSQVTLTAYVMIALLEAGESFMNNALLDGQLCLMTSIGDLEDSYSLAIVSYALAKAGNSFASVAKQKLDERAITGEDTRYWLQDPSSCDGQTTCRASPADVEMTAYALLAYLEDGDANPQQLLAARPIVTWLNSQRNGDGGFVSTQDTVIGLQALARYAELIYGEPHNLFVDVTTAQDPIQQQRFQVTQENSLVMQEFEIDHTPNSVSVFAQGTGCALLQTVLRYNLPTVRSLSSFFDIEVTSRDLSLDQSCSKVQLQLCITYRGPGDATNMATVEIKMVSGYTVDTDELEAYLYYLSATGQDIGLMLYDPVTPGFPFAMYFDTFDRNQRCFVLILKQVIDVKNARPAHIKVYDYYQAGIVTYKDYHPCA